MTNCYQFFVVADMSRSRDEIRVKKVADLPCKICLVCNVTLQLMIKSVVVQVDRTIGIG